MCAGNMRMFVFARAAHIYYRVFFCQFYKRSDMYFFCSHNKKATEKFSSSRLYMFSAFACRPICVFTLTIHTCQKLFIALGSLHPVLEFPHGFFHIHIGEINTEEVHTL